jgi:O-antigen/teichoic acid export membrane protein
MRSGVAWNLAGQFFTSGLGFLAVPVFVRLLGEERIGISNLAGSILFYLMFMDLGLGQALVQVISSRLASGEPEQAKGILVSSIRVVGGLSVFGGLVVCALAVPLAYHWVKVPPALRFEAAWAFVFSGVGIPLVLVTNLFRATLIAGGRFRELNLQRMLAHGLHWSCLLVGAWATRRIDVALGLTLLANGGMLLWSWRIASEVLPCQTRKLSLTELRPVLSMSGWMMVSSLVTPFLTQAERWVIGLKVGVADLAWYSTPVELAQKVFIAQGALIGVVLPNLARLRVVDPGRSGSVYLRFLFLQLALFAPLCALGALVAPEFLGLWLGGNFQTFGADPMRIACAGVVLNLMGSAGYTLAISEGRSGLAGKIHLAQVVPYLLLVWWVVPVWGIKGAAWLWALRVGVDAALFLFLTRPMLDDPRHRREVALAWGMAVGLAAVVAFQVGAETWLRRLGLLVPALVLAALAWLWSRRFRSA